MLLNLIKDKSNFVTSNEDGLVTFLNPYSYLLARKKLLIFNEFDSICIDGYLLVKILSLLNVCKPQRISFDMTSLAPIVFSKAIKSQSSIYIIGADSVSIKKAMIKINNTYPSLNIVGFRDGYFDNKLDRDKTIQEIENKSPNIVICGMGTPLQEQFLYDLKRRGWHGLGYTCGGFLHQITKKLDYYPKWINKFNMRWLYRIYDEPKLFNRYFFIYPYAILVILYDYMVGSRKNNHPFSQSP